MRKTKKFLVFPFALLLLFSFLPGLANAYDPGFDTNAASVSLYNMETGAALYEKNAATKTAPAATVQVMTALLVLDNVSNLDETVTITESMLAGV